MKNHITILGAAYIAFYVIGILSAGIVLTVLVGSGLLSGDEEAMMILSTIGSIIAYFLIITSLPGIIGGIGILKRQAWARILVLILGIMNLPGIPFGTALGGYTIWVLMNDEVTKEFTHKPKPVKKSA